MQQYNKYTWNFVKYMTKKVVWLKEKENLKKLWKKKNYRKKTMDEARNGARRVRSAGEKGKTPPSCARLPDGGRAAVAVRLLIIRARCRALRRR